MDDGRCIAGRYRLDAVAGEGGMATVWMATDLERRRPVAIKRIREGARDPDESRAMFADEVRVTRGVDHPRIVKYLDDGSEAQGPWLALDWIDGPDALTLLRALQRPLDVPAALSLADDLLEALGALHAPPFALVHRDVAPANVLADVHGRAFLADLGIARDLSRPRAKGPGVARGKLGYLAPEVLQGRVHGVRADVYGAALVLWELLAGRRVFAHVPAGDERTWHFVWADRPALRDVVPEVPARVAAVIDSALHLDPAARPSNALALRDALRDAARRDGVTASRVALATAVRAVFTPAATESPRRRGPVRATQLLGASNLVAQVA